MSRPKMPAAKQAIINSFLKLLKEKGYDNVMTYEIIQEAFVNKSTFYKYFDGKHSLLQYIETDLLEGFRPLLDRAAAHPTALEDKQFFVDYFSYIQKNFDLYFLLLTTPTLEFESMQRKFLFEYCRRNRKTREAVLGIDHTVREEFWPIIISSLYSGLFTYWVQERMPFSAEEMGTLINIWWFRFGTYGKKDVSSLEPPL